jgi:Tfp pilus assembly protein PilF
MKFLVPVARQSREDCQRMAAIFAEHHCGSRDAGQRAADAIQGLLNAIRLDPGVAEAEMERGAVYVKASHPEQALEWFDRALIFE